MEDAVKNDLTITDALQLMEQRKEAAGLYASKGNIESMDQIRAMWVSLDIDLDDLDDAINEVMPNIMHCIWRCMQQGLPPHDALKSIWADAFGIGVLYERQRSAA